MSLLSKLKKSSRISESDILSDSKFFNEKEQTPTSVPMINVALSGSMSGGLSSGLTVLAGPSKHFKTSFALLMASAYLDKHDDAVLLFYDSEFGSPQSYFESFGIDTSRVLHTPVTNIEELKFDLVNQLNEIERTDKVIVVIDSVGNIASKKELDDALNEKSVADMTRAKALKGLFRMITPQLTMRDIPLLAVNHTYMEQGMFPKAVVSGGTGVMYSADNVWIIGRQQDKKGTEVQGYHFIINVEKSRFVREKSKIPISVSWDGGIEKWSGLLDVALESGHVRKPKNGWYQAINPETGEELTQNLRAAQTMNREFWENIFEGTDFKSYIEKRFKFATKDMIERTIEQ
jgi:RecA/RadA recombinase|tara:strand:+ start:773 stop:1813 length:1041 start_codon:yes stop_codon:yes gene_type:complete